MMKKGLTILVVVIVVVLVGYMGYRAFNNSDKKINTGGTVNNEKPRSTDVVVDIGNQGGVAESDPVPAYPGSTANDSYTENGMSHAEYETAVGVTAKQVLDYYELELTDAGWQKTMRDVDDGRMEMLSRDGNQLRVSIFFTGYGDQGVVYFVDNRVSGGDEWPSMLMQ